MNERREGESHDLRKMAEQVLREKADRFEKLDAQGAKELLHELQVHQIELEMQNEELRDVQKSLEDAHRHYARLFHNAPVGYAVIDHYGLIRQANETLGRMAGREGSPVQGKAFADLLTAESAKIFRARFKSFFKHPGQKKMELKMQGGDTGFLYVILEAGPGSRGNIPWEEVQHELLVTITDITERKNAEMELESALAESRNRQREIAALLKGARYILEQDDFQTTARKVFDICKHLIGATSGYVALLSEDGEKNELLFLDSGGLPCTVDTGLPMPVRGLRAKAYEKGAPVYHNDFMRSQWVDYMPAGHVLLNNVMFAPLVIQGKTVGIIGLANKETPFDENDAKLAGGFGELAAIALQKGRQMDERNRIEEERFKLIQDLKNALSKVKQLGGLLPICMHCKKIRDDSGYWNQLESYISNHSEAMFSHSLCPECAMKYYPEYDLENE